MINYTTFIAYCIHARKSFGVKGILIYNGYTMQVMTVAGYPYSRDAANNDNEAKP